MSEITANAAKLGHLSDVQRRALDEARRIVRVHLKDVPGAKAWLIGSYAQGTPARHSDFDIVIWADPLPAQAHMRIIEELEESRIPYFCDVIAPSRRDDPYLALAEREGIAWVG